MVLKYTCAGEKWCGVIRHGAAGEAREGRSKELTFKASQSDDVKQGRGGDRGKPRAKQEDGFAVGSQKAGQVVT